MPRFNARRGSQTARAALLRFDATIDQMQRRGVEAITAVTLALEGWAKNEHTYQNRTGDLSASIKGVPGEVVGMSLDGLAGGIVRGYLAAGENAPYAWAVELAREEKWAFLWPTIERHMDDIQALLRQHLRGSVL